MSKTKSPIMKEEGSLEVYVGGIRTWKDHLLEREPSGKELESEHGKLWNFFQQLVGHEPHDKILQIEVCLEPNSKTKCDCDAEHPTEQDKLQQPCTCKGASGIITFRKDSTSKCLKEQLKKHKNLHPQGDVSKNADGTLNMCELCCYNNKIVRHIRDRPKRCKGVNIDITGGNTDGEQGLISNKKLKGIQAILTTLLGSTLLDAIAEVVKDMAAMRLSDAKNHALQSIESIMVDEDLADDIPDVATDQLVKIADEVITSTVINLEDTHCMKAVRAWIKQYTKPDVKEVPSKPSASEGDKQQKTRSSSPDPPLSDKEVDDDEEVTSKDLEDAYKELDNELNTHTDIQKSTSLDMCYQSISLVAKLHKRLVDKYSSLGLNPSDKSAHKGDVDTIRKKTKEILEKFEERVELLELKKYSVGRAEKSVEKTEKDEWKPSLVQIQNQITLFGKYRASYENGEEEIDAIISDGDIEHKKVDFDAISTRLAPNIDSIITNMLASAKKLEKWSNMKLEVSESVKQTMMENVISVDHIQQAWQDMKLKISKLDRKFQFSRKSFEHGASALLTKRKIEIFWGEEPGHKWQNLFEWIAQVELQICRVVHDRPSQVFETISHLSPKIAQLAKAEDFKTFGELKGWLFDHYVNEAKVLQEWQSRIGTVKVNKIEDVPLYISHTRGILMSIKEYAASKENVKAKLFTPHNVRTLVKCILDPLSKPLETGSQYALFMMQVWEPISTECAKQGKKEDSEMLLDKMDERLLYLNKVARMFCKNAELVNPETKVMPGTEPRYHPKKSNQGGQFGHQERNQRKGKRNGGKPSESSRGLSWGETGVKNGAKDSVVVKLGETKTDYHGTWKISTINEPYKAPNNRNSKPFKVYLTKENLEKAEQWENQRKHLKLPCWMGCGNLKPHELWNCEKGKSAGNKERFNAAKRRDDGPGTQCFTCLSSVCFITRCLNTTATGNQGDPVPACKRFDRDKIAFCWHCNVDSQGKNQKPMNLLICPNPEHIKRLDPNKTEGILRKIYGQNSTNIEIFLVRETDSPSHSLGNAANGNRRNDCKSKTGKDCKNIPQPTEVSRGEYLGADRSELFNTEGGTKSFLEFNKKEIMKSLKESSPGSPLYFMQQFNLAGENCLTFYDTGAMFNLIKTELARKLKLKMTTRRSMLIVGAGNQIHTSGDGKYEIILGNGIHGDKYVLEVAGSKEITNKMPLAEFTDCFDEVREAARKMRLAGHAVIDENEPLPTKVAGMEVKMIIGLTTPALQPVILFHLPSGLLVSRTRLTDVHGSRISFGGMFNQYKKFWDMKMHYKMSSKQVDDYTKCYEACMVEYVQFRDSVRMDAVYLGDKVKNQGNNEKWNDIIEEETDEMAEDSPIIIAGSEEKRGVQLHRQRVLENLILAGEKFVFEKELKQKTVEKTNLCNIEKSKKIQKTVSFNMSPTEKLVTNNILVVGNERPSPSSIMINNFTDKSLDKSKDCLSEGVYFDKIEDKISYYNDIGPDLELNELIRKETGIDIPETDNCKLGLSGLAAFNSEMPKMAPPINVAVKPGCDVDHGCLCSTGSTERIFDDIGEGITNSDAKRWQKLKQSIRSWEDDETMGTGIDFRCSKCIACKDCLKTGRTMARSQREEDEQQVIESSVRIDWEAQVCYVFLPWIKSPQELALKWGAQSNLRQATHFLKKMLTKSQADRESLTKFWEELKGRGVVKRLADLDKNVQESISLAPIKHFYPWNCVFKESITTPCRMVVDSRTSGLNDHLAKGLNTLNNLQQLLLRFRSFKHIGSFDISKMYNMLYIEESHLQYQLILWVDALDPNKEIEVWVMMRAIYGTVSSGNQAEVAIRRGAAKMQDQCPEGAYTIIYETYVDDGVPGRDCPETLKIALEQVETILTKIGFSLKCVTYSGQTTELSKKASSDTVSIGIAGYRYEPKADVVSVAMKECNFNPNKRGVKAPNDHPVIFGTDIDEAIFPAKLTRAQCVGKVAELFDLIGIFMPITMTGKILARLIAHLDWPDFIPQEMMNDWHDLVKKIQDLRHVKINRCVIPDNAKKFDKFDIMEIHDGSQHGAATTVYARCELKDNTYSTRLLFSRSSLCEKDQKIPRNELQSSHLGSVAAFITKIAVKNKVEKITTFGDSYVAFLWVTNRNLKLKSWCFARVQEIHRLISDASHFWVKGVLNIADKATKGNVAVEEVNHESEWQNGLPWMHLSFEEMREQKVILNYEEVMKSLNAKDETILGEEQHPSLPDLAAGARRNRNPELDFKLSTPSLQPSRLFSKVMSMVSEETHQVLKVGKNIDPNSKSCMDLVVASGTMLEEVEELDPGSHATEAHHEDKFVSSHQNETGPIATVENEISDPIPIAVHGMEVPPEFYSAVSLGISPSDLIGSSIDYPPNFSCLPGGYSIANNWHGITHTKKRLPSSEEEELQIRRFPVDVTHYGWKVSFKATSVWMYFRMKSQHKTHQIPSKGHHLFGKLTKKQLKIRAGLKENCRICQKRPELDRKGINMAYLDSLCNGTPPEITREDQILKGSNRKDWIPTWKNDAKINWTNMRIYAKQINCTLYATTRAGSKKTKKTAENDHTTEDPFEEVRITDTIKIMCWKYFMKKASERVTQTLGSKDREKFEFDKKEGIWKFYGRLLERREIQVRDLEIDEFYDSTSMSFVHPVGLGTDPLIFQILLNIHWEVFPHKGVNATNRIVSQILYVLRGGYVVRAIREGCQRCRRILRNYIEDKMGEIPIDKLVVSPAFSFVQLDTCGPFPTYSRHNFRSVLETNALVIICISTGAVNILALESLEAPSICKAILRHSHRYGFPSVGFTDRGPGLQKACNTRVELMDYTTLIKKTTGMKVVLKPTQSHEARGKVERAVQALKSYLEERKFETLKQTFLDWETSFSYVANYLNNLPIGRISRERNLNFDVTDILTPNRLLLGRNNYRIPNYELEEIGVTYKERLTRNSSINRAWFTLLNRIVPDLTSRPKWHKTSECPPKLGDYVMFKHQESKAGREHEIWKIGLVVDIEKSESSPNSRIFYIEYRVTVQKQGQRPEDAKVISNVTNRHLRELVLLFTTEELTSPPGSEEHLARLEKTILDRKQKLHVWMENEVASHLENEIVEA